MQAYLETVPNEIWGNITTNCTFQHVCKHFYGVSIIDIDEAISDIPYTKALYQSSLYFLGPRCSTADPISIISVNDEKDTCGYGQNTPKDRVMMLIADMLAAGIDLEDFLPKD